MKFSHNKDVGLLILRIIIGAVFIFAGYSKLSDMGATVAQFGTIGFVPFWAYVVAWVEFIGGISLVVGYGSKIASALLSIIMIVAIYVSMGGGMAAISTPLVTLGATLALFFTGAGKYGLGSNCGCPVKEGSCPAERTA